MVVQQGGEMEHLNVNLQSGLGILTRIYGAAENPPLILLHGWPASGVLWRGCVEPFSEDYRVIVPDLPGHGRSDKPVDVDYDLDFFVHFVEDLLDAMEIDKAGFVVHDIGALAGLGFAARFPNRVHRLVVMDTGPYQNWPLPVRVAIRLLSLKWLKHIWLTPFVFKQILRSSFHDPGKVTAELLSRYLKPWREDVNAKNAFQKTISVAPEYISLSKEELRQFKVPTLILWAEKDRFFPVSVARRLQRDIPGSVLEVIPDSGHFLPEEQPEAVVEKCLAFLDTRK